MPEQSRTFCDQYLSLWVLAIVSYRSLTIPYTYSEGASLDHLHTREVHVEGLTPSNIFENIVEYSVHESQNAPVKNYKLQGFSPTAKERFRLA